MMRIRLILDLKIKFKLHKLYVYKTVSLMILEIQIGLKRYNHVKSNNISVHFILNFWSVRSVTTLRRTYFKNSSKLSTYLLSNQHINITQLNTILTSVFTTEFLSKFLRRFLRCSQYYFDYRIIW